jgi:hypothetical protein
MSDFVSRGSENGKGKMEEFPIKKFVEEALEKYGTKKKKKLKKKGKITPRKQGH